MSKATDKSLLFRSYLAPKHWPLWVAIGILRLIASLPISLINKIGSAFGMLIYRLIPSRRRTARINLKQAYPDLTDTEIPETLPTSSEKDEFGFMIGETRIVDGTTYKYIGDNKWEF